MPSRSGVTIAVDAREIAQIGRALRQAARASLGPLTAGLAAAGESATRARLSQGGPGPVGEPWDPRHPADPSAKPLLTREGGLVDSLVSTARRHQARWGSNLVYARIHQLGGIIRPRRRRALHFRLGETPVFAQQVTIPARPYLGWGEAEETEAAAVIERWLDRQVPGGSPA